MLGHFCPNKYVNMRRTTLLKFNSIKEIFYFSNWITCTFKNCIQEFLYTMIKVPWECYWIFQNKSDHLILSLNILYHHSVLLVFLKDLSILYQLLIWTKLAKKAVSSLQRYLFFSCCQISGWIPQLAKYVLSSLTSLSKYVEYLASAVVIFLPLFLHHRIAKFNLSLICFTCIFFYVWKRYLELTVQLSYQHFVIPIHNVAIMNVNSSIFFTRSPFTIKIQMESTTILHLYHDMNLADVVLLQVQRSRLHRTWFQYLHHQLAYQHFQHDHLHLFQCNGQNHSHPFQSSL